jgi:hypothetical protein
MLGRKRNADERADLVERGESVLVDLLEKHRLHLLVGKNCGEVVERREVVA